MAGNDFAVDALFRKAGIVRCYSRQQLATVAGVLLHAPRFPQSMAIVTHAGGPAVLLTDVLEKGGFTIPVFSGADAELLKSQLYHGASVSNPIDVLATGNASQLALVLNACDNHFADAGAITVIFGSPGLFPVDDVYQVVHEKMASCQKPIFPVFPSVVNASGAISRFTALGHPVFTDEVVLGNALVAIKQTPHIYSPDNLLFTHQQKHWITDVMANNADGPLPVPAVNAMLDAMAIDRVPDIILHSLQTINDAIEIIGFPMVAKVVGPLHKTDVGGVVFPIGSKQALIAAFDRLMAIDNAKGVQLQPLLSGHELFVGLKREPNYGHLVMFGMGGIGVESIRDVVGGLAPLCHDEIMMMLQKLRSFPMLKGIRGQKGIDLERFAGVVRKVSQLPLVRPSIDEIDLNPIIGIGDKLSVVDARIIKNSSFG
jgi:acetyltransferase